MTCVRTWIIKNILNKMENKELEPPSPITTTEKKNQKIQEELQPEKNLQNIIKEREKQKRLVVKKKFQKKTKMKLQKKTIKKDHFH